MNRVRPAILPTPATSSNVFSDFSFWLWVLGLGLITGWLGYEAIGDFRYPLSDGNDTDQFEYVGYFFTKNLTVNPFPHLNLVNTQTFYPYGTNQVFLDWGFERDYWYRFCYLLFDGPGPYLQPYYLYTLLVSAIGAFILLQSPFGRGKAFVVGLIVSVFNFYGLYKFPVHMNVCIGHWTTLAIIASYRLLYDVLNRQTISLPFLLIWIWLHVQILGQELGYVAGFALTFTTLTFPVLVIVLYRQVASQGESTKIIQLTFNYLTSQWSKHKVSSLFCLFLIAASLYAYLPLTLQIALTAWEFDFKVAPNPPIWSHPARLLIPHLPGLTTYHLPYEKWFGDSFESYSQGSPGLYLVLLAGIGFWNIRRTISLWLPILLALAFFLLYHPVIFPTLKIFPWFSFNRHGGRASLVYPVLLCLLALPIEWPRQTPGKIGISLILVLMGMEWYTGYYPRSLYPTPITSDSVLNYCAIVRKQPGVAVLDWPFCTVGADGVGDPEGLCPYYDEQNAVFTFRRFYDKSGVGQYFGRLHPDQIGPFLRDSWPQRLKPGRLFTEQDWQFLDAFLRKNQFAGINLYTDLLTPELVSQFYQRYGLPIAETRFPAAGRVVFLPIRPVK
ncbi:hypothetical protein GCM10028805_51560 [Spirosoma harenae]